MTRDELIAHWAQLEQHLASAYEVIAKLDDEETGERQFAACVIATELNSHLVACRNARASLVNQCQGCGGSGRVPGSLAACPWCQPRPSGMPDNLEV